MLEKVALPVDVLGRYLRSLSGGQKQRVCIACALARASTGYHRR
nr:ATP-binding cassette domain-containing protein [Pseudaminobacter salicylatoxidans]